MNLSLVDQEQKTLDFGVKFHINYLFDRMEKWGRKVTPK